MTFKGITVQTMNDFSETMEQIEWGRELTGMCLAVIFFYTFFLGHTELLESVN